MQPRTPVCRFTSSWVCRGLHGPYYRQTSQTAWAPSSVHTSLFRLLMISSEPFRVPGSPPARDPGYWGWSCTRESWHDHPPFQEKEQPTQRRPNKRVHLSVSKRRRPLCGIARSLSRRRQCGNQEEGGQRRQWRRPAVSGCWISGSLRALRDSTARHTTSAADTSAFVVPVSQRLRKKAAAARCAARQSPWFCACSSFFTRELQSGLLCTFQNCFTDICLPHVKNLWSHMFNVRVFRQLFEQYVRRVCF